MRERRPKGNCEFNWILTFVWGCGGDGEVNKSQREWGLAPGKCQMKTKSWAFEMVTLDRKEEEETKKLVFSFLFFHHFKITFFNLFFPFPFHFKTRQRMSVNCLCPGTLGPEAEAEVFYRREPSEFECTLKIRALFEWRNLYSTKKVCSPIFWLCSGSISGNKAIRQLEEFRMNRSLLFDGNL